MRKITFYKNDDNDLNNSNEECIEGIIKGRIFNALYTPRKEFQDKIEELNKAFKEYKKKHKGFLYQPKSQYGYGTEDYIRECEIEFFLYKENLANEFEDYCKTIEMSIRAEYDGYFNSNSGKKVYPIKPI